MVEKIFALYDSDIFYATRFMEYFQGKREFDFRISVFTNKDSLKDFLVGHEIEILLAAPKIDMEEIPQKIKYIYYLSDSPINRKGMNTDQVYRYQSVRTLLSDVMNDYTGKEHANEAEYDSNQINLITVFSPIPGVEKLIFSWSVSSGLSEQGSTLFVPMDLFPVTLPAPMNQDNSSLTEFIYFLKEDSNVGLKIKTLSKGEGKLSILSGIVNGADLLSLGREDIQKWIEGLRVHTDYSTVVFYAGYYSEAVMELIKLSDRVYLIVADNSYEAAVLQEWERQMEQMGVLINQEKYRNVTLQEEMNGHIPVTMPELINSSSWVAAGQFL